MDLELNNYFGIIVDVFVVIILIAGTIGGYRNGFLKSTLRFIGDIITFIIAFLLKEPFSVFLYTNLPFFEMKGIFEGVSVLNIVIFELIAFVILWFLFTVILAFVFKVLCLDKILLSLVSRFKLPNKILGIVFGFTQTYLFVYFIVLIVMFFANFMNYNMDGRISEVVFKTPFLYQNFAPTYHALEDVVELVYDYKNNNDKLTLNSEALDILIKYDLVEEEKIDLLIENKKILVKQN